jgi:DNA-binding Lrp family transcriptional regulator
MRTEQTNQPFAVVPQALTAHTSIEPVDKLIFTHLLGKYQTKRDNGEPWTFSGSSIAKGTGLNERTVRRHLQSIRKRGILKLYGSLMNGKKRYDVFVFVPESLETLILSTDKMSVVILNTDKDFDALGKEQRTSTTDNESAQMSAKRKIVKGRLESKEDYRNKMENGMNPTRSKSGSSVSLSPSIVGSVPSGLILQSVPVPSIPTSIGSGVSLQAVDTLPSHQDRNIPQRNKTLNRVRVRPPAGGIDEAFSTKDESKEILSLIESTLLQWTSQVECKVLPQNVYDKRQQYLLDELGKIKSVWQARNQIKEASSLN